MMDMFSEKAPTQDGEIPDRLAPCQLTREERAAILNPNFSVADTDELKAASNIFEPKYDDVYDEMCGAMSLDLRRNYGLLASFRVMGVKRQNYQRALASMREEAVYLPLIDASNSLNAVFIMDMTLVSALFEVACGGRIWVANLPKVELGHWNTRLLTGFLAPLVGVWADGAKIETIDSSPEFSQSLAPNKDADRVEFSAKFGGVMGHCLLVRDPAN